ncbi:MAG: type II toxin-antitoxin system Phd/YefM family antitoxin [Burkholderiales bacterium]|nr:type II toxin-antitoxin system Phd/YefM family antitoxin [Burkholderiales bacterium]
MQITATEAKNRFGYFCSRAKNEPVIVEKDGRPDTVLLGFEEFQALKAAAQKKSPAQRKKEFNDTYREWIRAQNEDYERNGLWCEGLVAWQQP